MGFPLSTSTDACLGCSVAGYQSSEVAFAWRDVRRSVQIRPMGQASRGYSGTKRGLAQRAKVGYCPCCSAVTHVTGSPSPVPGSLEAPETQGMQLRKKFGPLGGRDFGARRSNMLKREMIKDQRTSAYWHRGRGNDTVKRLGIKKDGTILSKK